MSELDFWQHLQFAVKYAPVDEDDDEHEKWKKRSQIIDDEIAKAGVNNPQLAKLAKQKLLATPENPTGEAPPNFNIIEGMWEEMLPGIKAGQAGIALSAGAKIATPGGETAYAELQPIFDQGKPSQSWNPFSQRIPYTEEEKVALAKQFAQSEIFGGRKGAFDKDERPEWMQDAGEAIYDKGTDYREQLKEISERTGTRAPTEEEWIAENEKGDFVDKLQAKAMKTGYIPVPQQVFRGMGESVSSQLIPATAGLGLAGAGILLKKPSLVASASAVYRLGSLTSAAFQVAGSISESIQNDEDIRALTQQKIEKEYSPQQIADPKVRKRIERKVNKQMKIHGMDMASRAVDDRITSPQTLLDYASTYPGGGLLTKFLIDIGAEAGSEGFDTMLEQTMKLNKMEELMRELGYSSDQINESLTYDTVAGYRVKDWKEVAKGSVAGAMMEGPIATVEATGERLIYGKKDKRVEKGTTSDKEMQAFKDRAYAEQVRLQGHNIAQQGINRETELEIARERTEQTRLKNQQQSADSNTITVNVPGLGPRQVSPSQVDENGEVRFIGPDGTPIIARVSELQEGEGGTFNIRGQEAEPESFEGLDDIDYLEVERELRENADRAVGEGVTPQMTPQEQTDVQELVQQQLSPDNINALSPEEIQASQQQRTEQLQQQDLQADADQALGVNPTDLEPVGPNQTVEEVQGAREELSDAIQQRSELEDWYRSNAESVASRGQTSVDENGDNILRSVRSDPDSDTETIPNPHEEGGPSILSEAQQQEEVETETEPTVPVQRLNRNLADAVIKLFKQRFPTLSGEINVLSNQEFEQLRNRPAITDDGVSEGEYSKGSGYVDILFENIIGQGTDQKSATDRLVEVLWHEALGHKGLHQGLNDASVDGKGYDRFIDSALRDYASDPEFVAFKEFHKDLGWNDNVAMEEFIVRKFAEGNTFSVSPEGKLLEQMKADGNVLAEGVMENKFLDTLIASFKEAIGRDGMRKGKLDDRQIRHIMLAMKLKAMQSGRSVLNPAFTPRVQTERDDSDLLQPIDTGIAEEGMFVSEPQVLRSLGRNVELRRAHNWGKGKMRWLFSAGKYKQEPFEIRVEPADRVREMLAPRAIHRTDAISRYSPLIEVYPEFKQTLEDAQIDTNVKSFELTFGDVDPNTGLLNYKTTHKNNRQVTTEVLSALMIATRELMSKQPNTVIFTAEEDVENVAEDKPVAGKVRLYERLARGIGKEFGYKKASLIYYGGLRGAYVLQKPKASEVLQSKRKTPKYKKKITAKEPAVARGEEIIGTTADMGPKTISRKTGTKRLAPPKAESVVSDIEKYTDPETGLIRYRVPEDKPRATGVRRTARDTNEEIDDRTMYRMLRDLRIDLREQYEQALMEAQESGDKRMVLRTKQYVQDAYKRSKGFVDDKKVLKSLQRTPEFRKFFRKTKILGEDKKPLMVFNGATNWKGVGFNPYKIGDKWSHHFSDKGQLGAGFYFTSDPNSAEEWATRGTSLEPVLSGKLIDPHTWHLREARGEDMNPELSVIPAFLNVENPLILEGSHFEGALSISAEDSKTIADSLRKNGRSMPADMIAGEVGFDLPPRSQRKMYVYDLMEHIGGRGLSDVLQQAGFDGIWQKGVEGGADQIVAYDENNIKSAFNKTPTYSPDLLQSRRRGSSRDILNKLDGVFEHKERARIIKDFGGERPIPNEEFEDVLKSIARRDLGDKVVGYITDSTEDYFKAEARLVDVLGNRENNITGDPYRWQMLAGSSMTIPASRMRHDRSEFEAEGFQMNVLTNVWNVTFDINDSHGVKEWEVKDPNTGELVPAKINSPAMNVMRHALAELFEDKNPDGVTFTGEHPSRVKIYDRGFRLLAEQYGYNFHKLGDENDRSYYMQRKGIEDTNPTILSEPDPDATLQDVAWQSVVGMSDTVRTNISYILDRNNNDEDAVLIDISGLISQAPTETRLEQRYVGALRDIQYRIRELKKEREEEAKRVRIEQAKESSLNLLWDIIQNPQIASAVDQRQPVTGLLSWLDEESNTHSGYLPPGIDDFLNKVGSRLNGTQLYNDMMRYGREAGFINETVGYDPNVRMLSDRMYTLLRNEGPITHDVRGQFFVYDDESTRSYAEFFQDLFNVEAPRKVDPVVERENDISEVGDLIRTIAREEVFSPEELTQINPSVGTANSISLLRDNPASDEEVLGPREDWDQDQYDRGLEILHNMRRFIENDNRHYDLDEEFYRDMRREVPSIRDQTIERRRTEGAEATRLRRERELARQQREEDRAQRQDQGERLYVYNPMGFRMDIRDPLTGPEVLAETRRMLNKDLGPMLDDVFKQLKDENFQSGRRELRAYLNEHVAEYVAQLDTGSFRAFEMGDSWSDFATERFNEYFPELAEDSHSPNGLRGIVSQMFHEAIRHGEANRSTIREELGMGGFVGSETIDLSEEDLAGLESEMFLDEDDEASAMQSAEIQESELNEALADADQLDEAREAVRGSERWERTDDEVLDQLGGDLGTLAEDIEIEHEVDRGRRIEAREAVRDLPPPPSEVVIPSMTEQSQTRTSREANSSTYNALASSDQREQFINMRFDQMQGVIKTAVQESITTPFSNFHDGLINRDEFFHTVQQAVRSALYTYNLSQAPEAINEYMGNRVILEWINETNPLRDFLTIDQVQRLMAEGESVYGSMESHFAYTLNSAFRQAFTAVMRETERSDAQQILQSVRPNVRLVKLNPMVDSDRAVVSNFYLPDGTKVEAEARTSVSARDLETELVNEIDGNARLNKLSSQGLNLRKKMKFWSISFERDGSMDIAGDSTEQHRVANGIKLFLEQVIQDKNPEALWFTAYDPGFRQNEEGEFVANENKRGARVRVYKFGATQIAKEYGYTVGLYRKDMETGEFYLQRNDLLENPSEFNDVENVFNKATGKEISYRYVSNLRTNLDAIVDSFMQDRNTPTESYIVMRERMNPRMRRALIQAYDTIPNYISDGHDPDMVQHIMKDIRTAEPFSTPSAETLRSTRRPPPDRELNPPTVEEATESLPDTGGVSNSAVGRWAHSVMNYLKGKQLGDLKDEERYLIGRYKALGEIARMTELGQRFYDVFNGAKHTKEIYDFLTTQGANPEMIPDAKERTVAIEAKDEIIKIGEDLRDLGLLRQSTLDKMRGQYLPRIYLSHLLNDETVRSLQGGGRPSTSQLEYLKHRKDIPKAVRELILREVKDPDYLVGRALMIPGRDIALLNWFSEIAQNPDWAYQPSLVTFDTLQEVENIINEGQNAQAVLKLFELDPSIKDRRNELQSRIKFARQKLRASQDAESKKQFQADIAQLKEQLKLLKPRKVTGEYLKDEAARLRDDIIPTLSNERRSDGEKTAKEIGEALAQRMSELGRQHANVAYDQTQWTKIPNEKRYGKMKGMLVRKEIHDDIIGAQKIIKSDPSSFMHQMFGEGGVMEKGVQWWKWSKVAGNFPASHVRNFISNLSLMHLGGVPGQSIPGLLKKAVVEMHQNGEHFRIAKKYGLKGSSFSANELGAMEKEFTDLKRRLDKGEGNWLAGTYGAVTRGLGTVKDVTSRSYELMEALGKTMMIIDGMNRLNMSEGDAVLRAQKYLFDYSLLPSWAKSVRRNISFGSPFLTFYYKTLPVLFETARNRPTKFLPYMAMGFVMHEGAKAMLDMDEEEAESLRMMYPEFLRNKHHVYMLPWRDEHNRIVPFDASYLLPWGMFSELAQELSPVNLRSLSSGKLDFKGVELGKAFGTLGLATTPTFSAISSFIGNKDTFTKRPIWNERDTAVEQWQSKGLYLWNLITPTMLAGLPDMWMNTDQQRLQGSLRKLYGAMNNDLSNRGLPKDTVGQSAMRLIGINQYPFDVQQGAKDAMYFGRQGLQDAMRDMKIELRNMQRSGKSSKEIESRRRKLMNRIVEEQTKLRTYQQSIRKASGL